MAILLLNEILVKFIPLLSGWAKGIACLWFLFESVRALVAYYDDFFSLFLSLSICFSSLSLSFPPNSLFKHSWQEPRYVILVQRNARLFSRALKTRQITYIVYLKYLPFHANLQTKWNHRHNGKYTAKNLNKSQKLYSEVFSWLKISQRRRRHSPVSG